MVPCVLAWSRPSLAATNAPKLLQANVTIAGERVRDMSSRDLLRAAREAKAPPKPKDPTEAQQAARRAARSIQAWLRRSGAKSAMARAERHQGVWSVTVHLSTEDAATRAGSV